MAKSKAQWRGITERIIYPFVHTWNLSYTCHTPPNRVRGSHEKPQRSSRSRCVSWALGARHSSARSPHHLAWMWCSCSYLIIAVLGRRATMLTDRLVIAYWALVSNTDHSFPIHNIPVFQPDRPKCEQVRFPKYSPTELLSQGSDACTGGFGLPAFNIAAQNHHQKGKSSSFSSEVK